MLANNVPESTQGQADVNVPTFDDSPEVPVGAASAQPFDQDALVAKIVAQLGPEIDKRFQSAKDKRLAALDKLGGVDDLLALKDYIKAKGGNVDEAVREYQIDQMIAQRSVPAPAPGIATVADTPNDIKEWTAEVLNEAGIGFDDPEYKALAAQRVANRAEWDRKLTRFVAKRGKQSVTPSAASAIPSGVGTSAPVSGGKEAQLEQKYARLRELQQAPPTLETRKELKAVSDEIIKLGGYA